MKVENVLLFAGGFFIGYWLFRKPKGVISIDPKMETPKSTQKETIYLNLTSEPQGFYDDFIRQYNASKERTVAPASVQIDVKNDF